MPTEIDLLRQLESLVRERDDAYGGHHGCCERCDYERDRTQHTDACEALLAELDRVRAKQPLLKVHF